MTAVMLLVGITSLMPIGAPALAAGITVQSVTLQIVPAYPPLGAQRVSQMITAAQRGYSPTITMPSAVSRWVKSVTIKSMDVANPAPCNRDSDSKFTCDGSLEPSGWIRIVYVPYAGAHPNATTGTFTVKVSMGDGGVTHTGSGSVTISMTGIDLAAKSAEAYQMYLHTEYVGLFTLVARNRSQFPSDITVTITGLGSGPLDDQGHPCVRSGSTMECSATSVAPKTNFVVQFNMPSNAWRNLVVTMKVSGPVTDPNPGNNSRSVGPSAKPPAADPRPRPPDGESNPNPTQAIDPSSSMDVAGSRAASAISPSGSLVPVRNADPQPVAFDETPLPTGIHLGALGGAVLAGTVAVVMWLIRRRAIASMQPRNESLRSSRQDIDPSDR